MKKKWRKLSWVGCVALAGLCAACRDESDTAAKTETPEVKTFRLMEQEVTDTGEWFGYLSGKQDTDIHPHVSGFLAKQEYEDGSMVKKGDVLFLIDPATFQAELDLALANLQAAEASVASASASQEQAQLDVDRYEPLVGNGAVAEKDLDDARHRLRAAQAALRAAEAAVDQAKAAVEKAKINLNYTVVRAPYDGIIGTALVSTGDLVTPATKLANITSMSPMRFEFSVNSDRLIDVARKYGDLSSSGIHKMPPPPPVDIVLEDGSTVPRKGRLLALESKVSDSGLINVEGEVENPDALLRSGMPVRVRIPLEHKKAMLVPAQAIRSVLRSDFIIVVDAQNEPHMTPVTLGGRYLVPVSEENGYHSEQEMVAVSGFNKPLEETLRDYGYATPTEARIVVDDDKAVQAMNISSANSRLAPGAPAELRGRVKPVAFSFKPELPAAVAAAAAAAAEGKKAPSAAPQAKPSMPPYPVKVSPLRRQDVAVVDEWFGTLRGVEETDIRPKVSGFVLEQRFKDGSLVKKGDVLFTIDPSTYQASVDEARANLAMAEASQEQVQAQLDRSRRDYERYAKLNEAKPGAISGKTLTDALSAVKTNEAAMLKARATVAQMKAALSVAEINLGYTTIRAPFDGRVGIHKPSVGALVSPSDPQPLVTLSSVNPMRVDFQVSGRGALSGIAAFDSAKAKQGEGDTPPFEIVLEDGSVFPAQGNVVSADNALSKTTGTLSVVGQVKNDDYALRSGMPVRVRAALTPEKAAFLVPARAPLNAQGRDIIVLLRPDGTPDMLPIVKGPLVNVPIADEEGKQPTLQPMQIVDVDRKLVSSMVLAYAKAPSLQDVIFQGAGVEDWKGLVLKGAQVESSRALLEKMAGAPLPDAALAQAGAADWDALLLMRAGVASFRDLALSRAGAKDELDLIALGQGFDSAMGLVLAKLGYADVSQARVVVEGSLRAAQVYQANEAAGARVNKLSPSPFIYNMPRTVVESVTADDSSSTDLSPIELN